MPTLPDAKDLIANKIVPKYPISLPFKKPGDTVMCYVQGLLEKATVKETITIERLIDGKLTPEVKYIVEFENKYVASRHRTVTHLEHCEAFSRSLKK